MKERQDGNTEERVIKGRRMRMASVSQSPSRIPSVARKNKWEKKDMRAESAELTRCLIIVKIIYTITEVS